MHSNTSRFSDRKKKRTPTFPLVGRPAQVSFNHQKMARLEDRIEEAALAIQLKAIARAGAPRTSSKSPSSSKSKPEKKIGRQMTVANLNNLFNTLCMEELSSGLARAAKISTSLQTENENVHPISSKILSEQTKWFGRRR